MKTNEIELNYRKGVMQKMKVDIMKIKLLMANKGWNNLKLAKESGMSPEQISRILNQPSRKLRGTTVKALSTALGVKCEVIMKEG